MFGLIRKILLLLVIVLLGTWLWYSYQINTPLASSNDQKSFEIKAGSAVNTVSQQLLDQGLIKNKFYFELYVWLNNLQHNFVSGKFTLSPGMGVKEIVAVVTKTGSTDKAVTLKEGWSNKQIAEFLDQQGLVKKDDFLNYVTSGYFNLKGEFDFLKDIPSSASLEGYLFPDTYNFFNNSSNEQIVKKILSTGFDKRVTEKIRADILNQGKNLYDVVTLASIIEKEVRWYDNGNFKEKNSEDMKMVADIFLKRLKDGIPLQSDATINYLTNKGSDQPSLEDLKINSSYNTYLNKGLPPGPIANPSLYAIEAVVYPTSNPYYYFLTAKDGQVIYSKTYEEHLQNKHKYLD
jgi:UPF0755 protein